MMVMQMNKSKKIATLVIIIFSVFLSGCIFVPINTKEPTMQSETKSNITDAPTETTETTKLVETEPKDVFVSQMPDKNDYKGVVFQIFTFGLNGQALASGTGVIFDKSGVFMTNSHVIAGAVTARAVFEIENPITGAEYQYFDITQIYINDENSDLLYGVVDGYESISNYFIELPFAESYEPGDISYSIGYPNSATKMEVHKGELTIDMTTVEDKLLAGSSYMGSTSYIAPGSSGGLLLDSHHNIVGITTRGSHDKNGNIIVGASITGKSFVKILNAVIQQKPETSSLLSITHPEDERFIKTYLMLAADPNSKKLQNGYQYDLSEKNGDTNKIIEIKIMSDKTFYARTTFDTDGFITNTAIAGSWGNNNKIENIVAIFQYKLPDMNYMGQIPLTEIFYQVTVEKVIYSHTDASAMLRDYLIEKSKTFTALSIMEDMHEDEIFDSVDEFIADACHYIYLFDEIANQ